MYIWLANPLSNSDHPNVALNCSPLLCSPADGLNELPVDLTIPGILLSIFFQNFVTKLLCRNIR